MARRLTLAALPLLLCGALLRAEDTKQSIAEIEKQIAAIKAKMDALAGTKPESTEAPKPKEKKLLTLNDAELWESVDSTQLTNNGQWLVVRITRGENEGTVLVRNTKTNMETKYPGGYGRGQITLSFDSKWLTFSVAPKPRTGPPVGPPSPPAPIKTIIVELEKGTKTELEGFSSAEFSGRMGTHLALRKAPALPSGPASQGPSQQQGPPAP